MLECEIVLINGRIVFFSEVLLFIVMNEAHFEEETVQWKKANGKNFVK